MNSLFETPKLQGIFLLYYYYVQTESKIVKKKKFLLLKDNLFEINGSSSCVES